MIPLRTELRPRTFPWITWFLLALNVGVFLYQIYLGKGVERFFDEFALIPSRFDEISKGRHWGYFYPFRSLITSAFLHGSWFHLLGNMIMLWVFGGHVEDRLGHRRYLAFYVLAGAVSGLGHVLFNLHSPIPCVGASGAIAGVLGAALVLYPRARVMTLVPIFVIVRIIYLPAFVFLLLWFLGQLVMARYPAAGPFQVAVTAHIVGFIFGFLGGFFCRFFVVLPHRQVMR